MQHNISQPLSLVCVQVLDTVCLPRASNTSGRGTSNAKGGGNGEGEGGGGGGRGKGRGRKGPPLTLSEQGRQNPSNGPDDARA